MGKKHLVNAVVLLVILLTLTGCGNKATPTTTENTVTVRTQVTAVENVTTSTPAETSEQITIPPLARTITIPEYTPAATPIPKELMEQVLMERLIDSEKAYNALVFPDAIENEILFKFLVWPNNNGNYVTVFSATTLHGESQKTKEYRVKQFAELGYDISNLYDRLLELNENRSLLPIKSSIKEGFFINYNSKFEKYLFEIGGEVVNDYINNKINVLDAYNVISPHYSGYVEVSIPAYDPETGYVLVYRGWQGGGLLGSGRLYLLKYESGELNEIKYVETWVS